MNKKYVKIQILLIIAILLNMIQFVSCSKCSKVSSGESEIIFEDKFLDAVVKFQLSKQLKLSYSEKQSFKYSEHLKELKQLILRKGCKSLKGISKLKELRELSLSSTEVEDISYLKDLRKLRKLNLYGSSKIKNIEVVRNLKELVYLNVGGREYESAVPFDFTVLKELKNLKTLDISRDQIKDIDFLKNMKSIEKLYLSNNVIDDITPLSKLTQLKSLDLSGNQIKDIEPVKNLTNLTSLSIDNNFIESISSIEGLKNLKYISLGDNYVTNIDVFAVLENIETVAMSNNFVKDVRVVAKMKKLKTLYYFSAYSGELKKGNIKPLCNKKEIGKHFENRQQDELIRCKIGFKFFTKEKEIYLTQANNIDERDIEKVYNYLKLIQPKVAACFDDVNEPLMWIGLDIKNKHKDKLLTIWHAGASKYSDIGYYRGGGKNAELIQCLNEVTSVIDNSSLEKSVHNRMLFKYVVMDRM